MNQMCQKDVVQRELEDLLMKTLRSEGSDHSKLKEMVNIVYNRKKELSQYFDERQINILESIIEEKVKQMDKEAYQLTRIFLKYRELERK